MNDLYFWASIFISPFIIYLLLQAKLGINDAKKAQVQEFYSKRAEIIRQI